MSDEELMPVVKTAERMTGRSSPTQLTLPDSDQQKESVKLLSYKPREKPGGSNVHGLRLPLMLCETPPPEQTNANGGNVDEQQVFDHDSATHVNSAHPASIKEPAVVGRRELLHNFAKSPFRRSPRISKEANKILERFQRQTGRALHSPTLGVHALVDKSHYRYPEDSEMGAQIYDVAVPGKEIEQDVEGVKRKGGRERMKKEKKRNKVLEFIKLVYHKFGIRHFLLIAVLTAYAFIGAAVFHYFENPKEAADIQQAVVEANSRRLNYTERLMNLLLLCSNSSTQNNMRATNESNRYNSSCAVGIREILQNYDDETGLSEALKPPLYHWDFWNSFFYAYTIFTTIGYGNMSCKTMQGQLATIIYAVLGIPLMITMLNDLGKVLFMFCHSWWNFLCRCVKRHIIRPIRQRKLKPTGSIKSSMTNTTADVEIEVNEDFPLILAILIIFIYMFFCAFIFKLWEDQWDYFTSFYFFFISLSTVGLGDVMPNHPHYTTIAVAFFLVGLALVSMFINVLQAKVEAKYMEALGMLEDAYLSDENAMESNVGTPAPGSLRSPAYGIRTALGVFQAGRPTIVRSQLESGQAHQLETISDNGEPAVVSKRADSGNTEVDVRL